jgi:hypothetical protein
MSFHADSRTFRGGLVPWCADFDESREAAGELTGTFRLRTGRGLFGTVAKQRLRAWLYRAPFGHCEPPQFDSYSGNGGITLRLFNSPPQGEIVIWGKHEYARESPTPNESHEIGVTSPKLILTYSADLSSASATGIGPFFSGQLSFKAPPAPATDFDPGTSGRVTGNFSAAFAAPGPFTVPSGTTANLFQEAP